MHVTGVTGSGKTLAFVLPLAALLKKHEETQKQHEDAQQQQQQHARPRLLILVPSKELATQTQRVVKVLPSPTSITWFQSSIINLKVEATSLNFFLTFTPS